MAQERISRRKIKEVLRLHYEAKLSQRVTSPFIEEDIGSLSRKSSANDENP
jgi:hypothetical protein